MHNPICRLRRARHVRLAGIVGILALGAVGVASGSAEALPPAGSPPVAVGALQLSAKLPDGSVVSVSQDGPTARGSFNAATGSDTAALTASVVSRPSLRPTLTMTERYECGFAGAPVVQRTLTASATYAWRPALDCAPGQLVDADLVATARYLSSSTPMLELAAHGPLYGLG
jgi:hypothetical protein